MNRRRAWVTGGAGFLGSHLCDRLLDAGTEVWCIDNLSTGRRANLVRARDDANFHFTGGDCTSEPLLRGLPRPDVVFHLASPASPPRYRSDPLGTVAANAWGTWRLLAICEQARARFVLASTSEVYGDPEVAPQPESYRGRVNCFGPRACYEESKRLAETLVWEHLRRGVDARVARIFNTFGPRLDPADGRVVPSFIVRALRGLPLPVHGDGLQTRTLLYVDDLVDGLLRLASDAAAAGTLVNLGGETELRVLELGRLICRLAGVACRLEHRPAAPDDPRRRRPDLERARALLRWSPRTPVDEGLLRTIAWFRSTTDLPHQAP